MMKRVILSGCNGTMGQVLGRCISRREDCTVVAGFDLKDDLTCPFPVFTTPSDCGLAADVVIDFSHPSNLSPLLAYCRSRSLPVVIATTGLDDGQVEEIRRAAGEIPVFYTANMSLGVNLMVELAKKAAEILGGQFDIEIVEKHHNQKIDAPSGTALMLADAISESLEHPPQYVYDRHSKRAKREKNEIGIHAVRGGTIVGEHEVLFAGPDELLTISHSARSKEVFATGAVNAALFLCGRQPGLYSMKDLI